MADAAAELRPLLRDANAQKAMEYLREDLRQSDFLPIIDSLLRSPVRSGGVAALVVYRMKAPVNSQKTALRRLKAGYEKRTGQQFPITFARYAGDVCPLAEPTECVLKAHFGALPDRAAEGLAGFKPRCQGRADRHPPPLPNVGFDGWNLDVTGHAPRVLPRQAQQLLGPQTRWFLSPTTVGFCVWLLSETSVRT